MHRGRSLENDRILQHDEVHSFKPVIPSGCFDYLLSLARMRNVFLPYLIQLISCYPKRLFHLIVLLRIQEPSTFRLLVKLC